MSALLKQKAKVGVATKTRKLHDIADVFMKRPMPDGSVAKKPVVILDKEEVKKERDPQDHQAKDDRAVRYRHEKVKLKLINH